MSKPSNPPKNGVQIYIPPKLVIAIIAILLGSGAGGFAISNLLNGSGAEEKGHKSDSKHRDREFNVRFEHIETTQTLHTEKIEALDDQMGQIQAVQHSDIARTEARRLTEKILNRARREEETDRLFLLNMRRLKRGRDPCQSRKCVD